MNDRWEARLMRSMLLEEDEPLEDALDVATFMALKRAIHSGYLFRQSKNRKGLSESRFKTDLPQG
jgi:hypothetical protein